VKARLEIGDTCLRPLQCHCKKQAKPKEDLQSPLYPSHEQIVSLSMFKWVTLEIWRKLFLAPRNLHAQLGRNLWHVESNRAIFICINPFFHQSDFFEKNF
jgi:hypothetical protein